MWCTDYWLVGTLGSSVDMAFSLFLEDPCVTVLFMAYWRLPYRYLGEDVCVSHSVNQHFYHVLFYVITQLPLKTCDQILWKCAFCLCKCNLGGDTYYHLKKQSTYHNRSFDLCLVLSRKECKDITNLSMCFRYRVPGYKV